MRIRFERGTGLLFSFYDAQRCQFGLTEAIGFGLADLGIGAAADATVAGAADIGAGVAATDAVGTGIADATVAGAAGAAGTGAADIGALAGTDALGAAGLIGADAGSAGAPLALTADAAGGAAAGTTAPALAAINTAIAPAGATSALSAAAPAAVGAIPDATATGSLDALLSTGSGTGTAAGATAGAGAAGAPLSLAAPGTAAGGASSSISDLLGTAGSGALKSLTSNPLGTGLGIAGLGYNIYEGQKNTANENSLQATAASDAASAGTLANSGQALQQYLTNGTLPPAYQQQVDQAIADAKTSAISNAAAQGLPTDPTKNTALAETLAKIDASKAGMQTQVASQLFSSGATLTADALQASGLSGNLYSQLVQNDTNQAANTGKAIATLAAALNGKTQATIGNTPITVG